MTLVNKLLGFAFAVVAFVAWLVSFGVIKKKEGKAEAIAEHTASELEAVKERKEYVDEIKGNNRSITPKQLFSGLRKHAKKNGD